MIVWQDMTDEDRKEVGRIQRKLARLERQEQMNEFAVEHELVCFVCGSGFNRWGKTGVTNGRAWAVCLRCVRKPK